MMATRGGHGPLPIFQYNTHSNSSGFIEDSRHTSHREEQMELNSIKQELRSIVKKIDNLTERVHQVEAQVNAACETVSCVENKLIGRTSRTTGNSATTEDRTS